MDRLDGKVALITGGARGIGLAFARRFLHEGAKVVLADLDVQEAQKAADACGPAACALKLDVTCRMSMEQCVKTVIEKFGHIDILVNSAAIFDMAPLMEITPESYEKVFAANVFGTLFMTQAVSGHMISRGKGGKIINVTSQAGRRGSAWVAVYSASKAAVISLTQSTGLELVKHGIHVNCIAPGFIDTQMWRQTEQLIEKWKMQGKNGFTGGYIASGARLQLRKQQVDAQFAHHQNREKGALNRQMAQEVPIGRVGHPEDITGMALFLASADSDYVVAQTYNVDGGWIMS